MKNLVRSLWPAEPEQPKWRPLRAGEQVQPGTVVSVQYDPHDGRKVYRWMEWAWMGRERFALLDAGDGNRYQVAEGRLRLPA